MNSERLLAHLERISEAPDAIARLRRFILDLAVRGKLVEQDPEDEPADSALRIVRLQKQIIQVEGRIRKDRNTPVLVGNPPFALPAGWQWLPFGEIHWLVRGVTYTKTDISDAAQAGYVPVLRAGNIGPSLTLDDPVFVRSDCISDDQYLQEGDFLIALSSGSKSLVGKAALVGDVDAYAFGGFCGVIRLVDKEYNDFTGVYLQSDLYREAISLGSRGIGINNLKKEVLANAYFPLPPLAVQHRIVAKVDELMSLCDQLEAARQQREQGRERLLAATLQRLNQPAEDPASFRQDASFALQVLPSLTTTPAQIKQLRQTILNLAVRGKLVEQDPEDESAEELLAWIAADRKLLSSAKSRNQSASIQPLPIEAQQYSLPCNWVWVRFGDIMYSRDGERVPVSKDERSRLAKKYDYYGASGVIDKIDGYLFDKPLLLIGEDGANLLNRSTPIAFIARGQYWVNNHAHVLDGISEEFLRFMELSINATDLSPYVTGTAQPKMNQAKMNSIPIALPPLAEQHRIVAKVDELMALCDQLEQQLSQADQQRRRLLEAVLAEALGGRLTVEEESHANVA